MKIVKGGSRAKFVRKIVGLLAGMAVGVGSTFAGNIGSGGDISYVDDGSGDVIHVFLTSGTFVSPPGEANVRVLLVGGGGGAGSGTSDRGGGAGAGGFVYDTGSPASFLLAESSVVPVTVGAGGTHGASGKNGQDGGASSFAAPSGTLSAAGGGGGKTGAPGSGGSTPGAGAGCGSPLGFNGGSGGGAGGAADSTYCRPGSDRKAGRGGPGLASDITGVSVSYGGGGGGGYGSSWLFPCGVGRDGGADGAQGGSTNKGADGRGGGGGGSMGAGAGGDGGSGIVIVRYHPVEAQISAAITITENNAASARLEGDLTGSGLDDVDWVKIYFAVAPIADDLPTPSLLSSKWTIGEHWKFDVVGLLPCTTYRYLVRLMSSDGSKQRDFTNTFTTQLPPASGGDGYAMMLDGSYLMTFTAVGSTQITFPSEFGALQANYLLVGGGGAAGLSFIDRGSGGGGGGQVVTNATASPLSIAAGATVTVTVGKGGDRPTSGQSQGQTGGTSSIAVGGTTVSAAGGTGGYAADARGGSGGSSPNGGAGAGSASGINGGGGGGAGGPAYQSGTTGHGGPGAYCDITGEDVCYGGGGGGGYAVNGGAGAGGIGGGGDGGCCSRNDGVNGLGGGGGGAGNGGTEGAYGGGGGSGFVAIRYKYVNPTASALPAEPYATFDSAEITPDTKVALGYRAYWAGATSQRVRVEAYYGLDAGSLTGKVVLADSAIGSGTAELAFPLAPEPRTFYFRLAFISADGTTAPSTVRSVTMPTVTAFTAPAPVIDAKARTIAFRGTVGPFGVGSTTLKLAYGRTAANLTEQLTLATGSDGGAAVEFDSGTIACGKPVRMSELYYRYVLEETYNGTVVQREVVGPVKVRVYTPGLVVYFQ